MIGVEDSRGGGDKVLMWGERSNVSISFSGKPPATTKLKPCRNCKFETIYGLFAAIS